MKVGELLLEAGLVDAEQIEAAMKNRDGLRLGSALIAARAVEPDVVARTLAQQLGVPPARSADLISPDPAARAAVPLALCKRLWALPYALHGSGSVRVLEVAMRDPEDQRAIDELNRRRHAHRRPHRPRAPAARGAAPARRLPAVPADQLPPSRGAGGNLGLDLDERVPRNPAQGRRGAARTSWSPPTTPVGGVAGAVPAAAPGAATPPLPPLQYDNTPANAVVTKALKWAGILVAIVALGFVALRFKKCMTPTTKAVGTHYDSTHLAVGIDFPESKWRVSFDRPVVGGARAEYFYRGGVPEAPVVAMVLTRGPAEDIGDAARRVLEDLG